MKIRPFILAILTALMASLFSTAPLKAQVTSSDATFTPSILKSGLSTPSGIAFRRATGDLVVTQTSAGQVSLVDASSGATKTFVAQPSANEVAVRASDGLIAVATHPGGPIDFYSSTGTLQGSIAAGSPNGCIGGLAFDNSGNLFVAAGPQSDACSSTGWSIYEFAGPTPWTVSPFQLNIDGFLNQIEGLTFSAATPQGSPPGSGVLYAVSPTSRDVYQIFQTFCEGLCFSFTRFAQVPLFGEDQNPSPSGIAVDPLLGNIYISELSGQAVVRLSPPDESAVCCATPTPFATGFTSSFGLTFDRAGNLYVNETNAGNVWKFSRAAFSTPEQAIVLGQTLTFTNQTKGMTDQIQTMLFPPSTSLCDATGCAAFIRAIFVPVDQNILNARLAPGSQGSDFFGGGGITQNSMCTPVPSASPNPANPTNCLVTLQVCSDANGNDFDICSMVHVSSGPDRLQLTSTYNNGNLSKPVPFPHFGIDFDAPTSDQTGADVTTQPDDCCTGSGGPKSLCSGTFFYTPGTSTMPDFSLGAISPSPITVPSGGSSSAATVPVTSVNNFSSPVALGVADVPAGVTATLNQSSVTPAANAIDMTTTLTVSVNNSSFDSASTIPGIEIVIANLLASGCIDNSGTANGLTSKLAAAQAALNAGRIQDATNVLGAFKSEDLAQAGKHIGTSCTATFTLLVQGTVSPEVQQAMANVNVTGTNAATILAADASTVITTLAGVNTPDPVTGYVQNNGAGVMGATVSLLLNGLPVQGIPTTTTDGNGFYYFANTTSLTKGLTYTVQVTPIPAPFTTSTPPSQTFTWAGKGLALAIFNLN